MDEADSSAVRGDDQNAVEVFAPHTPATPKVAIYITAHPVRRAAGAGIDVDTLISDRTAVRTDIVGEDFPVRLATRLDNIEGRLVRREAQPIRPKDIIGNDASLTCLSINPVDSLPILRLGFVPFVVAENAKFRVSKPDRSV